MPYNEELTGLEDLDWAKRAMKKGYYIAYTREERRIDYTKLEKENSDAKDY